VGNKKKSVSFQNINLVCPNKFIHIHRHNLRLFKAVDRRVKKTLDHKINVKVIFFFKLKERYTFQATSNLKLTVVRLVDCSVLRPVIDIKSVLN